MLWIRVVNPNTNLAVIALAIVDTGADDCVFPANTAIQLDHNLTSVPAKQINTAGGVAKAYPHTSRVDILAMTPNGLPTLNILHTIQDTPIDFIEGGSNFLLGARKFLNNFLLMVGYPRQIFSIRHPN